jgi:large subunit ribosomal protein L44e
LKVPPEFRTYCPKCNQYTVHSVSLYKAGKRRAMARGERHHERVDRHGYGGSKAPLATRNIAKTTKKQSLRLKCKVCGAVVIRHGIRLKKLEVKAT